MKGNRKTKLTSTIIALSLCAGLLCGCQSGENTKEDTRSSQLKETAGEISLTERLTAAPEESVASEENVRAEADASANNSAEADNAQTDGEEDASAEEAVSEKSESGSGQEDTGSDASGSADAAGETGGITAVSPDEGTISKPSHEEEANASLIFIGDSRTEDIRDAVSDDSIWCCKAGAGYEWMSSEGVPSIEARIGDDTAVIILMGVNDVNQVTNYVNYINVKANEWADLGAKTYFVSVGPVESDPYATNSQIEKFNSLMEANLMGVTYIDLYSHLVEIGYQTVDGSHYTPEVSAEIYNFVLDNLDESSGGMWG